MWRSGRQSSFTAWRAIASKLVLSDAADAAAFRRLRFGLLTLADGAGTGACSPLSAASTARSSRPVRCAPCLTAGKASQVNHARLTSGVVGANALSCRALSFVAPVGTAEPLRKCDGPSTSTATLVPRHVTSRSTVQPSDVRCSSSTPSTPQLSSNTSRTAVCSSDGFPWSARNALPARAAKSSGQWGSVPLSRFHSSHW
mmetsp:Transcript_86566/g.172785  ORF Transcript_86566/g.172785 Transcript_86566/m.172785 type:complete len:200 (-) Transcript_86566:44-643(-)